MSMLPLNSTATVHSLVPAISTRHCQGTIPSLCPPKSNHPSINAWSSDQIDTASPSFTTYATGESTAEPTAISITFHGQAPYENNPGYEDNSEDEVWSEDAKVQSDDAANNNYNSKASYGSSFMGLFERRLEPNMYKTNARKGGKKFCDAVRETKKIVSDGGCSNLLGDIQRLIDDTHDAKHYDRPEKYHYVARQAETLQSLKSSNNVTQDCPVWTDDVRDNLYEKSKRYLEFTGFRDGRKASTK